MEKLKNRIIADAEELLPEVIRVRRFLHMHPELSYAEIKTSEFISSYLTSLGIDHQTGIAGTGIVAVIRGKESRDGLTLGIRADMDALPVTEDQGPDYRSLNEGIMHACGHDAHVAMLLGTATLLMKLRREFKGTVLLVFQPGEEKAPGGARLMLETGIFEKYKPDMFIAQHVLPELPAGVIGFHAGPYMASCDEIYITVKGKGGHAAQPSQYTDQIYIASELVIKLKDTINSMSLNHAPTILGIGHISGPGATNVIPEKVEIACTFRTFDEAWRNKAKDIIRKVASETATKYSVSIDANIVDGYPVLVNDEEITSKVVEAGRSLLGYDNVTEMPVRMSSEDFSFFSSKYPSCLFRLGISSAGKPVRLLHTPSFDINEQAMATGVAALTWMTMNFLSHGESGK